MSDRDVSAIIRNNLQDLHHQMAAACDRVGRDPSDVSLVAVTKYAEWEWVEALAEFHHVFGENRPQQLVDRKLLRPEIEWHLIGQLQRNKVRSAIQNASLIHSVDSLKLLQRIALIAREEQQRPAVLLQVNVSGEESKSGFAADELEAEWHRLADVRRDVDIRGLMTMAPASDDPESTRSTFRGLRELRDDLNQSLPPQHDSWRLAELSMGMSSDFAVAIEEGATLVRIGSRLFAGLD